MNITFTIISNGTGERTEPFVEDDDLVCIGRGRNCHIVLNGDKDISRQHVVIVRVRGRKGQERFLLRDLSSRTGTKVSEDGANEKRRKVLQAWLDPSGVRYVYIGQYRLELVRSEATGVHDPCPEGEEAQPSDDGTNPVVLAPDLAKYASGTPERALLLEVESRVGGFSTEGALFEWLARRVAQQLQCDVSRVYRYRDGTDNDTDTWTRKEVLGIGEGKRPRNSESRARSDEPTHAENGLGVVVPVRRDLNSSGAGSVVGFWFLSRTSFGARTFAEADVEFVRDLASYARSRLSPADMTRAISWRWGDEVPQQESESEPEGGAGTARPAGKEAGGQTDATGPESGGKGAPNIDPRLREVLQKGIPLTKGDEPDSDGGDSSAARQRRSNLPPLARFSAPPVIAGKGLMTELIAKAIELAPHGMEILIEGPSGAGKELVARAVHHYSGRTGRFVAVDCGALHKDLAESLLFGHVRGAFPTAKDHIGHIESAHHGTLFLDEIHNLPLDLQVKFLRVLEDKVVQRVGSTESRVVDVQVVIGTNRDLDQSVANGAFLRDLFFRIKGIRLRVPRLDERPDDIPLLVHYFLDEMAARTGKPPRSVEYDALNALRQSAWPGNVRELRKAVERAFVLGTGEVLSLGDFELPATAASASTQDETDESRDEGTGDLSMKQMREREERQELLEALESSDWSVSAVAKLLKCPPNTIRYRMQKYRFHRPTSSNGGTSE